MRNLDRCQKVLARMQEENKRALRQRAEMLFLARQALETFRNNEDPQGLVRALERIIEFSEKGDKNE